MKDGKYHVFIDGKERTINADKFENNYEAIVRRYPEAKIRVSRENQLGDIPLKNYRKAIGSNRYTPYISKIDEAKEASKKNIQPEASEDKNPNDSVQQSPAQVPLPDKPVSSTKSSVQPTNSTPSANKSILYANNPDLFTNFSVPIKNDPVPSANEPDPTIPIARFIKGKDKDKTVFGIPYEIYERMKPETKYYYYQQAVDAEKDAKRKVIESQINATRGEVSKDIQAEYLKDTEARMKFQREHPVQSAIQDMAYGSRFARTGIDTSNPMFTNSKIKALHATANRLDDAKEVLDESKKKGKTNFVMGSFRGLGKSLLNTRTWDSGIIGGLDNSAILSAIDATENGKADVVQQRLLDAAAIEMAVNQEFGDDIGRGYKAGKVTGESVPFMIEFMTNPASGMGKSVSKSVVKRGIEKFGKDAMRTGLKKMQMSALRAGADALGAGTMSLTTGMGRVVEDAERRMIGTIRPVLDENGYIRYGGAEGGESFGKALIKAYGAITIENYSEMLGNYFEPMFSVASNATAKGLSKIGLGKVNDVISNIKASDWVKSISAFEKQAQWNGTIGEYAEEVAGNVLNSIFVGDQTLDTNPETGVFNLNNNIDTFLGVSIMGGFLSSLKTGGYMTHKYTAGKRLKKAESNGEHVFENKEQWESVRESINNANEEGIVLMLEDVYHSDDYTPEQKKAVFTYAAALKGYQGANLADLRRHTDGDVPPAQLEAEGAFDEGYSLNEPQEKNEAKLTLDQSIADVQKGLGLSNEEDALSAINEMGDSPAQILMTMDERGYPEESIRSVSDYLNAKARYDGMIESAKDGIEGEIESQVQYIDKNTHKDGNLYSATMKMGDRKVYITGGNVAIQEDGLVDHEKSDKSIIIRDAETGKIEMVDVRDLLSVQPGISAESHKAEISEQIRQDYAQRASDEINGVLAFAPGDVYAVLNPESGIREELTILQADGDVAIVSDGAGEQMEMAKGELQSLVDQERMSRIQEKRQAMQSDAEEVLPSGQEDLPVEQEDTPDENKEVGVTPAKVVKVLEDGRTAVLTASDDKEATFDIYDLHGELEDSDDMPLDEFYKLQDYVEEPDVELDDDGFPISENRTDEPVLPESNNEEPASLSVAQESENAIPVDENGNALYHKIPVEKTIADINDGSLDPEEVDAFVSANKTEAEKLLKKIAAKSPKVSTDKAKYLAEKQAWQENMAEAQARVDYWNEVETQIQSSRIQPGDKTFEEITSLGDPLSAEEFTAMMLGKGKLPLLYHDYKRETGFSNNEARGMFGLFAGRDKGGMTIEEAGEKLMDMDEGNGTKFFDQTDANAGRNAIIDLLSSVKTRGGLINLIKNNREKMAERERQAEVEADEIAKEQWYQDNAHMTIEEHELWSQGELLSESNVYSVDEYANFYNNFADDILKENSYDSRRERIDGQGADIGESHEQGRVLESRDESHEILQGEEIVPTGRVEGHQGESGKVEERTYEILHPANDGLQDSPSGRNGGIDESVPETENLPSSLNSEGDGTFSREQENVSIRKDGELATFEKTGPTPDDKITDTAETHKELQSDTAHLQDNGPSTGNNVRGEDNKQDKGEFVSPPRLDGESLQDYAARIDDAYLIHREEQKVNTSPTEAQKKAGNYKKAHIKVDGFDITIENPKGSERRGVDDKGKPWSVTMNNSYGYIRGTEGVDGDHIDLFMGNTGDGVYVVDQVKEDGTFDEHKVMYGFGSLDEAKEAYLANYSPGWKGLGNITGVSKEAFKKWVDSSHRKTKPFAEYKKIERIDGQSENSESLSKDIAKELGENLKGALHLYGDVSLVSSEKVLDMARKVTSSEEEAIKLNRSDVEKFISLYRDGYEKSAEMLKKHFGIEIPDAKDMVEQIYAARNGDVYKNKFAIIKRLGSNILNYSEALEEMERVENSTESYKKYKAPGAAFSRQQKDYRKAKGDVEYYRARINGDIEEYKKEATEKHGTDLQENIRFREINEKDGSKSLIGLHNISEDKLSKALKLGGLANPSAAVIDIERQTHDGYGEISLILPSSMIAKSTGRNAGTFSGDAWTPTYPQIERQFADEESSSRVYDDISKLPQDMHSVVRSAWNSYMDGRDADALAYQFLYEKEKAPDLSITEPIFSEDIRKKVTEADAIDDYDDRNKAILNAYIDERFDGDRTKFEDYIKIRKRVLQKKIDDIPSQKGLAYRKAVENLSDIEEKGYEYNSVKKFYDEVISDIRRSGSVDTSQTVQDVLVKINQSPKLRREYEEWKEKLTDKYGIKEVLFKGFTPSGKRIYLPHTLENVSKIMKQQGLAGATGWGGSFSKFAAGLMKSVGKLSDIRRQKGKLTTNYDDIDTFREKWEKVYFDLGLKLNPDARGFDDSGLYRVEEIATKSNPKSFAKREYGVDLSDEDVQQLKEMVEAIRNEYPAMYFETKYERPVMLNEFAGAVVPDNVGEEITAAMEKAGLRLFKYKVGDELSRNKALKQASGIEGVRFRVERDTDVKENYDRAYRVIDDFKEKNAGAVEAFVIYSPETLREQLIARNFDPDDIDKYEGWLKDGQTPAIYTTKQNEDLIIILDTNVSPEKLNSYLWHEHAHKAFNEIYGDEMQLFIDRVYESLLPIAKNEFDGICSLYADNTEEIQREECVVTFFEEACGNYGESLSEFIDILENKGINDVGVLKDIYNYIHYGERKKLGGNDSRRIDKNGIPKGVETRMEMRDTGSPVGNPEESGSSRDELSGLREAGTGKISQRSRRDSQSSRNDFRGILEVREGEIPQSTEERGNGSKNGRELRVRLPDGRNYIVFDENDLEIVDQKRFRESDKDKKMRQTKNTFKTYHGSGAAFDQFDVSHTGEGQGESMVGRGVYTSKSKKIAEKYADVAKNKDVFGNKYLYEVRIPVDNGSNYLDYDKLYDAKELDAIATRMQDAGVDVKDAFDKCLNGRIAYGQIVIKVIAWCLPENADVNKILSKAGYVGCKYSTKHDIGKNERSNKKSYVVFDEDNASIIKRNQIESHAKKMSDLLRSPIKIIRSIDELDNSVAKRAIENGRNVKGWYDANSGEVVLYLPNATSADDIQATVLHEVVAHYGLRKLFGEDFDKELMNIYEMLPEDVRKDIATDALRNYGSDLIIATEEYLARQAEKNEMPGWWNRVVSSFKDFLRKMGVSLNLSDNDVRYLLWRSRKNLEQNNPFEVASDIDMKNRLGIGEYGEKKRYRETIDQDGNLFAEEPDERTDKNSSLLDAYKNRIFELNGRIASLERKIDSHITAEELSNEVIEEIKKEIGSDIMSEIGKKDLSSLLHQVQNAKTKKSLEKIFMNVKRVALAAQTRKLQRMMDKLLVLKVQDVNGKNMSIAKNVDDSTRRIFTFIRGKLSDMKKSGLEDDILYLKRENRNHREEIARLERTLRESKDAKTKDEAISAIETYKKTIEENKERIKELTQEKNEIEKVVADAGDLDVENEMAALNEKMDRAAQDKAVWTQSDSERMAALNIISGQLMNKKHDFEIQSIESDIRQRVLENADRYRDRRKEVSENKRRQITNAINENRRQIVALDRLINDTRSTQVQQLQMTIEQLEELINNGKSSLLRRTEEEVKRKSWIIGQSIRTIEGKPIDIYDKESDKESLLKKFFSAPLGSFEYMCKRVNTKTLGKDGFLYKYFIKGNDGVMKAHDTYISGMEEFRDRIDEKSTEILGKKYSKMWSLSDKVENETGVHFIDTNNGQRYGKRHSVTNKGYGVRYEVPLSKGQAMYIYQVWKMNDGRTKLELQGIDEESIAEIRDFLGEKYIKFADWIQEELLPETREKYNAKYIEMHGTSLSAIKDYVPLRIIKKTTRQESDLSEDKERKKTLEERAGSLINRVMNTNPVDITMSAFDVLYEHGRQMEEWNAYARVRRDLDAILSNTTFKNQLNTNTRGSFGNFYDAAAVATSAYHPDQNKYMDEILGKLSKGIVGGNIAWRLSTALKQILSAPAFWGYSQSPLYMKALITNSAKMPVTFKWCMDNIPSFRERVTKGTAGNEKLDEKSISKYLDKYIETGMIPNKLVDAVTCSIGAKSIFDYKYGQLLKSGLAEEEARSQALVDADIYYNQTQQSSHPAFLSPMQMSRSIMDRMVTTYQNSNIGYVRKVLSTYYDLTRSLKWKELEKNYTDMFMEDGISRDEAARMAYRRLLNENKKTAFEIILFGWGMNLLWNMGSKGLLGLFAGDDDDDNWAKGISFFLTSPIKGMPGGNLLASIASGYGMNPVLVYDELDKFMKEINLAIDEYGLISPEIAYATLEKASRYGGVDLEVLGNIYLGVEGMVRDGALTDDKMIDLMFILNSPKSNRVAVAKNLYKDESVFSFAEKVARANKYISKRDPWEGWVPGVKEPTKRRLKEIEKSYNRLHMTDDEKKIEDEKKIADKHRRKLKELKDNPYDLADYIDSHIEQHKIYQKYY